MPKHARPPAAGIRASLLRNNFQAAKPRVGALKWVIMVSRKAAVARDGDFANSKIRAPEGRGRHRAVGGPRNSGMTPDMPICSRRFATAALVRRFAESPLPRLLTCCGGLRRFPAVVARREDVTFKRVSRQRAIRQRFNFGQRARFNFTTTLRFTTFCNFLQRFTALYNVLQRFTLQRFTTIYNVLQRFTTFCNILQR